MLEVNGERGCAGHGNADARIFAGSGRCGDVAPIARDHQLCIDVYSGKGFVYVDKDGYQGDWRDCVGRQYDKNAALLDKAVALFMTRHPVTIGSERLVLEVLHLLESHRIDDLVVLHENRAPVGLVDTRDPARFRLL